VDNECPSAEGNEASDINEVLPLPNLRYMTMSLLNKKVDRNLLVKCMKLVMLFSCRVSIDDLSDAENEVQSQPTVIRSINEKTGECSEHFEQNDENIFSSFKQMDTWTLGKCRPKIHV
jgi:hypothetical protein